jgi:F-type H+-transporting ATPase subunit delta
MPMVDAQPDALALVYARTLMDLVESKGGREAVRETQAELEEIVELARANKAFGEFLASRVIATGKRGSSLRKILDGRVSDVTVRFLLVLNSKGRLSHLSAISAGFDQLAQEKFGRVEVDVYTAAPIDQGTQSRIRDGLESALKKEVVLHPYTEAEMIGGIKIRVGDQFIDASVASQLRRMQDKLSNDGQAALKSRIDSILG